jgi:peptide/nickel transport system substrate-binding protein
VLILDNRADHHAIAAVARAASRRRRGRTCLRPLLLGLALAAAGCGRRADVGPVLVSVIGAKPTLAGADRADLSFPQRILTDSLAQGLVRFDAGGQIEAGVAERWIVTDGGMSYIFRLRNLAWPDGAPVRATEVVTLLRCAIATPSRNSAAPYLSAVASIVEMTPEVIEISLTRPRPDLLKLFAQPELALVRARSAGGAGPFRIAPGDRSGLLLTPAADPDRDPDDAPPQPEDNVRLRAERAAAAIVRFVDRGSDLVSGGTFVDWPILQAAGAAPVNIRVDPAAGLFGLAIARRDGFLATAPNRAAVAAAIDRTALTAAFSPEWTARETILPDQLDSAVPPSTPAWATAPAERRIADARATVATWRSANGVPSLGIALPSGPGGTLLWGALARDLYAIGVRPVRLAADDPAADLRLVDRVAPYDSARWYLAEACVACAPEASAAIEAARIADTLAERSRAIGAADAALTADVAFIPLARPFRWSLVALRLRQWQPNARAWHPLNRLRDDTN